MYVRILSCLHVNLFWSSEVLQFERMWAVVCLTPQFGKGHLSVGDLPHCFKFAFDGNVSKVALRINFIVPFFKLKI